VTRKTDSCRVAWLYEKSHLKQPFIQLGLESLHDAGCRVVLINMLNASLRDKPYAHIGLMDRSRFRWLNTRLLKQYGAYRFGLLLPFLMLKHALNHRPHTVIANLPVGLMVGAWLKRLLGCRLVYYPLELYGEQASPYSGIWKWQESRALKRVDALITQNSQRAEVYTRERGARVPPTIVNNYKRRRTVEQSVRLREQLKIPADQAIVLYEGMLTDGRWLDRFVQAVAFLPERAHIVLLGKIDNAQGWWDHTMAGLLQDPAIRDRVSVLPWVKPDQVMDYVAGADAGLIIYDNRTRNNYFCAPGKLSDYVLARVPIVAPNFPSIGTIIERYRIGATFDAPEPRAIARAVMRVLSVPKETWREALDRAARELIWESQLPNFLAAVLGSATPACACEDGIHRKPRKS
jgi:glycosyltransferase involved in cell wall biosynthesis